MKKVIVAILMFNLLSLTAVADICRLDKKAWVETSKDLTPSLNNKISLFENFKLRYQSKGARRISRAMTASGPGYCVYQLRQKTKATYRDEFTAPVYLLKSGPKLTLVAANDFESFGPRGITCSERINSIRTQARLRHGDNNVIHRMEERLHLSSSTIEQWSMKNEVKIMGKYFLIKGEAKNPQWTSDFYCQIQAE